MSLAADAVAVASEALGPVEVRRDHSWATELSTVLEVRSACGVRAIVKAHQSEQRYATETYAYDRWVPAIADRAPTVLARDDDRRVLVLSLLPGETEPLLHDDAARQVHRDAGAVLRRFHEAEACPDDPEASDRRVRSYRRWVGRAPEGLLDADDLAFAETYVTVLGSLPAISMVPSHGDWSPRNWIVTGSTVAVIDFERAERAWWTKDLERLWWRDWLARPDLREAFFDGYGRRPTETEEIAVVAASVLGHITTIVWGTQNGDLDFAERGRRALRGIRANRRGADEQ